MTWATLGSPLLQTGDTGAPLAGCGETCLQVKLETLKWLDTKWNAGTHLAGSLNRALRWVRERAPYSQTSQVYIYFAALVSCWLWLLLWPGSLNNRGGHSAPDRIRAALISLLLCSDWNFGTKMKFSLTAPAGVTSQLSSNYWTGSLSTGHPTALNFSCWF